MKSHPSSGFLSPGSAADFIDATFRRCYGIASPLSDAVTSPSSAVAPAGWTSSHKQTHLALRLTISPPRSLPFPRPQRHPTDPAHLQRAQETSTKVSSSALVPRQRGPPSRFVCVAARKNSEVASSTLTSRSYLVAVDPATSGTSILLHPNVTTRPASTARCAGAGKPLDSHSNSNYFSYFYSVLITYFFPTTFQGVWGRTNDRGGSSAPSFPFLRCRS